MTRTIAVIIVALAVSSGPLGAQETKPVPNDSVRVSIPGCARGSVFTAGPRTVEQQGSLDIPEGMHLRMNGPKKVIAEIKAHEGSMIEITGLIKKGQRKPDGIGIGGVVRVTPGATGGNPIANQIFVDVEGWRPATGNCPSR